VTIQSLAKWVGRETTERPVLSQKRVRRDEGQTPEIDENN